MKYTRIHELNRLKKIPRLLGKGLLCGLVTSCTALSGPSISEAAPNIYSVTSQSSDGKLVSIQGEDFLNPGNTFAVQDSASSISILSSLSNVVQVGHEDVWMSKGSNWASPLSVIPSGPAPKDYLYYGEGKAFNGYIRAFDGRQNPSLYVAWDYMPSESPAHSGGSNKFIRIWDDHGGEGTRISWTQMHMTYSGSSSPSWGSWPGTPGQWNKMEIWADGEAGIIRAYVNGKQVHKVDNFLKKNNGIGLNIALLGFDANVGSNYKNMKTFIDNLYVSTTRARVLLSPADTWEEARGNAATQLVSSWSPTEIKFFLDPEAAGASESSYVYVVNSDGEANHKGYELCLKCPAPPKIAVD